MKQLLVVIAFFLMGFPAQAQVLGCPEGYTWVGSWEAQACAPIPGYQGSAQDAPPPDPGPQWASQWGAIAVGGGGFGAPENMATQRKAEKAALKLCRQSGGGKQCKVLISYYNQCAAIAWGDNAQLGAARGPEVESTKRQSINSCSSVTRNCKVYYAGCSYPVRVR